MPINNDMRPDQLYSFLPSDGHDLDVHCSDGWVRAKDITRRVGQLADEAGNLDSVVSHDEAKALLDRLTATGAAHTYPEDVRAARFVADITSRVDVVRTVKLPEYNPPPALSFHLDSVEVDSIGVGKATPWGRTSPRRFPDGSHVNSTTLGEVARRLAETRPGNTDGGVDSIAYTDLQQTVDSDGAFANLTREESKYARYIMDNFFVGKKIERPDDAVFVLHEENGVQISFKVKRDAWDLETTAEGEAKFDFTYGLQRLYVNGPEGCRIIVSHPREGALIQGSSRFASTHYNSSADLQPSQEIQVTVVYSGELNGVSYDNAILARKAFRIPEYAKRQIVRDFEPGNS